MWFSAGMIPFYLNLRDLDLLDSRWGIVISFAVNAFNIILMRNFFESVSPSFEEAARMDGANDFQILWKVYMPLAKPAIATVAMLCAISRWNGYFWAMVLLRDEDKIPLQVYLEKGDCRCLPVRRGGCQHGRAGLFAGNSHRRHHCSVHHPCDVDVPVDAKVFHQRHDDGRGKGMISSLKFCFFFKPSWRQIMIRFSRIAIAAAIACTA